MTGSLQLAKAREDVVAFDMCDLERDIAFAAKTTQPFGQN